jgi:molybdopterin synthase catalytic subunit
MLAAHNGVVRGFSRTHPSTVVGIEVKPDYGRIGRIQRDIEARPGIFRVLAESEEGCLKPGDDLLRLVVAGDIREHVIPALSDLLERIKSEAIQKKELFAKSMVTSKGGAEPAGRCPLDGGKGG